jgi:hypothetical protein
MTEKPLEDRVEQSETHETISRRHLLRVLAGTSGAVAAWSLLPGKWTRPIVEASMLPRNLQASPTGSTLRINNLSAQAVFTRGRDRDGQDFRAGFDYADDLSHVDDSATLAADIDPCGQIFFAQSLSALESSIGLVWNGTASSGHITFPFNGDVGCINGSAILCVTLGVTGRSALACTTIPPAS